MGNLTGSLFDNSGGNLIVTDLEVDGTTLSIDAANNRVGMGTTAPGTQLQVESNTPYVTLKNDTSENTAGGCESKLIFEDHGNNALGQIEVSHVGSSDDEKGQLVLSTNNDSGLQAALTLSDAQVATFAGDVTVSGGDATLGTAGNTTATTISTIVNTGTTVGKALTIAAGSTTTGANNLNGGDLVLSSGSGDGTGTSSIQLKTKVSGTDVAAERMRIHTDGKVGIGTAAPTELLTLSAETAYIALQNTTAENGDGGAETRILFVDHSPTPLAQIEGSHSGSADDTKGKFIISTHTGSSLTAAVTVDDTQKATFAGTVSLAEAQSLSISTPLLPSTDHTSTGLTAEMLAGGTIAAFQTVCVHTTTGEVVITDSNAIATMPVIGIAPAGIADTNTGTILLQGFIRDDDWGWTIGGILYASETAGAMTQTAPTTSGAFVQALGIALSADVVYFNPSLTLVEVA